jgi:histidine triad (HIT) family protein
MTTQPCTFCKIASAELPAVIVYKDELVTAFRDIHPVGPVHVLVIPNKHIASLNDSAIFSLQRAKLPNWTA